MVIDYLKAINRYNFLDAHSLSKIEDSVSKIANGVELHSVNKQVSTK